MSPGQTTTDGLVTLCIAYRLDADVMQCRRCKRHQQVTWRDHAFPHAAGCKNETAEARPWLRLVGLVADAGRSGVGTEDAAA